MIYLLQQHSSLSFSQHGYLPHHGTDTAYLQLLSFQNHMGRLQATTQLPLGYEHGVRLSLQASDVFSVGSV